MTTTGPNRILDELAKLFTDAAGAAQGVRREVETAFKAQAERLLNSMEVVQREEFEAVRDMAVKARAENKALAARIDALEARFAELSAAPRATQTLQQAAPKPGCQKIIRHFFPQSAGGENRFSVNRLPGFRESFVTVAAAPPMPQCEKRGWSRNSPSID